MLFIINDGYKFRSNSLYSCKNFINGVLLTHKRIFCYGHFGFMASPVVSLTCAVGLWMGFYWSVD